MIHTEVLSEVHVKIHVTLKKVTKVTIKMVRWYVGMYVD